MCIFCAAIPVTVAFGAKAHTEQRHQAEQAKTTGQPVKVRVLSAGQITGILVAGLAIGSVVTHTHLNVPL